MPIQNDFLPFAAGSGANVITQSAYAVLTALPNGFASGIAQSNQVNKVLRQASVMAGMLAQFIVDNSGQPAVDDGTTTTLEANLLAAVKAVGVGQNAHSFGTSGYQKLASGFILQWGLYSLSATVGSSQAVTFPVAFVSAAMAGWCGVDNSAGNQIGTGGLGLTGMTVLKGNADNVARTGTWFAIGN